MRQSIDVSRLMHVGEYDADAPLRAAQRTAWLLEEYAELGLELVSREASLIA